MNKLHESLPKEKGERLWVLDSAAAPRRPRDE
jgi:hypothetical protein